MKTKEFNLSEKRLDMLSGYKYPEKDVKEFIKKLKKETPEYVSDPEVKFSRIALHRIINKLVGDKLI